MLLQELKGRRRPILNVYVQVDYGSVQLQDLFIDRIYRSNQQAKADNSAPAETNGAVTTVPSTSTSDKKFVGIKLEKSDDYHPSFSPSTGLAFDIAKGTFPAVGKHKLSEIFDLDWQKCVALKMAQKTSSPVKQEVEVEFDLF